LLTQAKKRPDPILEYSHPVVLLKDFSDSGGTSGSAVRKANGKHGALVQSTVLAWAKNRLNPFRSFSLLRFFYSPRFLLFFKGAHECFAFGPAKEMKRA
jgi:hypothetical protein